jgi:hypothetical protein
MEAEGQVPGQKPPDCFKKAMGLAEATEAIKNADRSRRLFIGSSFV